MDVENYTVSDECEGVLDGVIKATRACSLPSIETKAVVTHRVDVFVSEEDPSASELVQKFINDEKMVVLHSTLTGKNCHSAVAIWESDNNKKYLISIYNESYNAAITIVGPESAPAEELRNKFAKVFGELKEKESENVVRLRVGYYAQNGPHTRNTSMKCLSWEEIRRNYIPGVIENIEPIMTGGFNPADGRLIIWHGGTGTGKTWAIRSLMRQLKKTHNFFYVSDADIFLDRADYYFTVISEEYPDDSKKPKPTIFVMEDSADPLLEETRKMKGNHISRILNLTDGILAQGREDLFLLTFNENVEELDSAIVRPGRCLNVTEFKTFTKDEAREWLKNFDIEAELKEDSYTLAELYAVVHERRPSVQEEEKTIAGFVAPSSSPRAASSALKRMLKSRGRGGPVGM